MQASEVQQQLFSYLRENLPPHLSLVDELGELLGLSADSVYRRIRGEKPVSIHELKKICEHYRLSLDQLLQLNTDTVVFRAPDLKRGQYPFIEVLKSMLQQLKYFNSFGKKEMLYLCKDMPIWQFYLYPELGAFKSFVWAKTIHNEPELAGKQFSLADFPGTECNALGVRILQEYNLMPSVELWNEESINSTLNQLRYYKESGGFKNKEDINRVIDSFDLAIDHLRSQAEKGHKFMPGDTEVSFKAPVQLYVNEIVIGSNTIMTLLDDTRSSFIPYNVFSFMFTRDPAFNESIFQGFQTLKSRSTLISGTGEKERNRFFSTLKDRIHQLKM